MQYQTKFSDSISDPNVSLQPHSVHQVNHPVPRIYHPVLGQTNQNFFKGDFFLGHGTKAMTIFMILIIIITINTMMTLNIWTMITITVTRSFSSYRIITKIIVTDRNITLTRGIFF